MLWTGLLTRLRCFLTALVILPAIVVFLLHGFILRILVRNPQRRLKAMTRNVERYSRVALEIMRIEVRARDFDSWEFADENFLIVCNHLSYLDLLVLASLVPVVFVTSIDMGEVFFLGTMCEIGGAIFIERRHRDRLDLDITQLQRALESGFHVALFPEGTSGNGETVLPFKRGLLPAATRAGVRIKPVTLKYTAVDRAPIDTSSRDHVCWYGTMSFLPHLLGLMGRESVVADLAFHPAIPSTADRDILAAACHRTIAASYGTPLKHASRTATSDPGLGTIAGDHA